MQLARSHVLQLIRFLGVMASLLLPVVHADEYSEVNQLTQAGRLQDALTRADQYLATNPKDPQMRLLKGVLQKDLGRTPEALSTFTHLTQDHPELPEPYNNLAVIYAAQGQFDKARSALEAALRTNPSYSTAHDNLGDVYAKLASLAYYKALQLEPSAPAPSPKLALLRELGSQGGKTPRPVVLAQVTPNAAPAQTPTFPLASLVTKTTPAIPTPVLAKPQAPAPTAAALTAPPSTTSAMRPNVVAVAPSTAPAYKIPAPPAVTAPTPTAIPTPTPTPIAKAAASAKPPSPTSASSASASSDVQVAIKNWATAWAAKDMKTYLGSYGKEFVPPSGLSRSAWEEERKQRISSKSHISVKIDNLAISINDNKAVAKFHQDYKASGLAVSSRKVLELVRSGARWQIVRESTGN
jgi:tetratricopeptide (TPR) repeat protein